jgi:hypothetical protein
LLSAFIVIVEGRGVKFSPMQRMGSDIPKNKKLVGAEAGKCACQWGDHSGK